MKQGILGVKKNDILFTVEDDPENNRKYVYLGFERVLSVPNNKKSAEFQYAIIFLYRNGIAPKHIEENFAISFKTIKKWEALTSSCETLKDFTLSIKHAGRTEYKVTDEIRHYIISRVDFYKKENVHNFNVRTVKDVETKYSITLSVETIRNEYAKKENTIASNKKEDREDETQETNSSNINTNKDQLSKKEEKKIFQNMYAGVLLVSAGITHVARDISLLKEDIQKYIIVWLYGILLGFRNLENYRYKQNEDFKFICQINDIQSVEAMRNKLKDLSMQEDLDISTVFLKCMIKNFKRPDNRNFYIDGHEIEYTGDDKILQGWNTKKNRAAKGYTSYFVHDGNGNPLFSNTLDHFYDFREVIRMVLPKIKQIANNEPFVLIFDRGGFSFELMKEIEQAGGAYICWEKGFDKKSIDPHTQFNEEVVMEFPYNDVGTYRSYTVKYCQEQYIRNDYQCQRILILRKDKKCTMTQSILASDSLSCAPEIIRKLLARFIQENDFKKQKNHFGIDEITSYRKLSYNELNDKVDKKIYNTKYRDKLDEIAVLKIEHANIFKELGIKYYKDYEKKIKGIKNEKEIITAINEINERIHKCKNELKKIEKTISKIKKNQEGGIREIDLRQKRIMDMIKIAGRNIFHYGSLNFLNVYKNLRDYQKVFRLLTQSSGIIEIEKETMYVKLKKFGGKKFQIKCEEYFQTINELQQKTHNGKYILHFDWST